MRLSVWLISCLLIAALSLSLLTIRSFAGPGPIPTRQPLRPQQPLAEAFDEAVGQPPSIYNAATDSSRVPGLGKRWI